MTMPDLTAISGWVAAHPAVVPAVACLLVVVACAVIVARLVADGRRAELALEGAHAGPQPIAGLDDTAVLVTTGPHQPAPVVSRRAYRGRHWQQPLAETGAGRG